MDTACQEFYHTFCVVLLSQRPIVVISDAPVVLPVSSCQWPDWYHVNIHTAPRHDPEEEQVGGHLGQRSIQRALTSGSPKCSDGRIYYTYVTFPLPKQKLISKIGCRDLSRIFGVGYHQYCTSGSIIIYTTCTNAQGPQNRVVFVLLLRENCTQKCAS